MTVNQKKKQTTETWMPHQVIKAFWWYGNQRTDKYLFIKQNNPLGELLILLWNALQSLQNQLKEAKFKIDVLLGEKLNLQKDLESR